jgi:hypothetical protein
VVYSRRSNVSLRCLIMVKHMDSQRRLLAALVGFSAILSASVVAGAPADAPQSIKVQCVAFWEEVGAKQTEIVSKDFIPTQAIASSGFGSSQTANDFLAYVHRQHPDRTISGNAVCKRSEDQHVDFASISAHNAWADKLGNGFHIDLVRADWPPGSIYPPLQVAAAPLKLAPIDSPPLRSVRLSRSRHAQGSHRLVCNAYSVRAIRECKGQMSHRAHHHSQ